ncbi:MAG: sensor histidine kinase [Flavobacterium sp.]|uniref:sensor histidine kinase n=1 Tax=Flavobacterium sp. TaxID=239 RepID=UPI001216DB33|nr:histidine kinase [Flavobacterium sp.]RZJ63375.1 MAG: sensor histidine kinase [Flavobacterium sp.]
MKPISFHKISALGQILVFAGLLILQCLPVFWGISMPAVYWEKQLIMFVLWFVLFYVNLKILLPHLLFKQRSGFFFVAIVILILGVTVLSSYFDDWLDLRQIMNKHFKVSSDQIKPEKEAIGHFWTTIITLLLVGCSTVIGVGKRIREESITREALEKDKINSELSFLKAQINPHFLFNILNSIYALSDGNPEAKEAVYNLSHLMRYVLYDTRHNLTSLSKEVAFVEDYIKLMELRLAENVQVIFDKPAYLKDVSVAPMLFLPFIENAYKHGISSLQPSFIYIGITQKEKSLEIEVRNSLFPNQPTEKEESNGIGLVNTRRRLALIYPNQFTLDTIEDAANSEYRVNLKLELS